MIKLTFTTVEIKEALVRAGYEIRHEEETVETYDRYFREDKAEKVMVWNAYYRGNRIDVFDAHFGFKRIELIFEREVQKRILGLF